MKQTIEKLSHWTEIKWTTILKFFLFLKNRYLLIKKAFIPFYENIGLGGEITQKYPIILKCLPVFSLLQPYVNSTFFIRLTELLMD